MPVDVLAKVRPKSALENLNNNAAVNGYRPKDLIDRYFQAADKRAFYGAFLPNLTGLTDADENKIVWLDFLLHYEKRKR